MRKSIYILIATLIAFGYTSCEEVIELDLADADPRLVIEGFVTDQPGPYTVEINKSAPFYENNTFPPQSGASVVITDSNGNEEVLTEVSQGIYETATLQGERGVTYTLTVQYEGSTYVASSKMPEELITLDSIGQDFEEESLFYDEGFYVTAYYNDPAVVANYYRHNVFVNGEVYLFNNDPDDEDDPIEDDNFWLWRDKYSDGNLQDYQFPHTLVPGDSVYIELHHLERSTFDYYRTLVDVIDGGGVAPANPISNFGDTALGYFGAFSITSNSIIIQ